MKGIFLFVSGVDGGEMLKNGFLSVCVASMGVVSFGRVPLLCFFGFTMYSSSSPHNFFSATP